MNRSIGGLFLLVNGYLASKAGAGDVVGKETWSNICPYEKSA
jgi:hypothetical protein